MPQFLVDLFKYPFLQYAVAAGVLASTACGIVGSYVVVRRTTYIAGAISHCVLGGLGMARYLQRVHGVQWMTPLVGATIAAVLAAWIIGWVVLRARQRVDTVLSAVWALGMAIGVSFIMATPGYNEDLMSYLFGNILMVSPGDLWLMAGLNVAVVACTALFFNPLLAISFNEEAARLRGVRVEFYELLFLTLTALTVVLLVKVVGTILAIALLTLPAALAACFASRLSRMMMLAALFCLVFTVGGLGLSYAPEWPAGATVVELAGAAYLLVILVRRAKAAWRARSASPPRGPD